MNNNDDATTTQFQLVKITKPSGRELFTLSTVVHHHFNVATHHPKRANDR
jgi:hypothetical protein